MIAETDARSLHGKVALVTGASRGIGRAIALALGQAGARIGIHYASRLDAAEETLALLRAAGGDGFLLTADLAGDSAPQHLFEQFDAHAPHLDILVNNAGIGVMASIAETDEALFDRQMAVNVKGPFFVTRAALPRLRDGGRIINLSSMVAAAAYPACIAYAMTKSGVDIFTRSLAAELGPRGITVNAIAPGATETDFIGALKDDPQFIAALAAGTALGRLGTPADIAAVALFLASPAGGWVTGQVLQASGGMHL